MSLSDQLALALYSFLQSPASKVAFGLAIVVLLLWGVGETRRHAYKYAVKGSKFGATSALVIALILLIGFAYVFVDKRTLADIVTGKRPLSELPQLGQATLDRFQYVLGSSTDQPSQATPRSQITGQQVQSLVDRLSPAEREKLELQMCRQFILSFPTK